MSKHPAYSYVEIDDADMERNHLWVTVNDADGNTIELIERNIRSNSARAHMRWRGVWPACWTCR